MRAVFSSSRSTSKITYHLPFWHRQVQVQVDNAVSESMAKKTEDKRNITVATPSTSFSNEDDGPPPLSRKVKLLTAASVFYGNVTLGCAVNSYGPTLTSFQKKYDTDDATISTVFSISIAGLLVGALSSGVLYKYVNRQLAVSIFFGCMGLIMFLTPHCPTLTSFFISAGLMGIVSGFYGSAQFVWIMEMMQKDCPPYVQSQHFFYAFGTILSTLIMAPFLDSTKPNQKLNANLTLNHNSNNSEDYYAIVVTGQDKKENQSLSNLFFPFSIIGSSLLLSMIIQLVLFTFFRYRPPPPEGINDDINQNERGNNITPDQAKSTWHWPKIRLMIISCLFFGATQAMENSVIQFIPKFGQNSNLHLSQSQSTYILTGLTTAYSAARFLCIFIVFKVPSQLLLCLNIVITFIANILLIGWAQGSLPVLWASSILFGLGFSSMFASFSAYMERYLTITDLLGSLIVVCGSGMAAAYPQIIGNFIEDNPTILGYTTFISIAIVTFSFASFTYITHKDKTKH